MRKCVKILRQALYIFICALPSVLFCVTSGELMLPLAAAVFLHESAHILALRLCGGRMCGFRPVPFGLCIQYDENSLSLGGEIAVSGAGCAVNLLSAAVSLVLYRFCGVDILDFGIVSLLTAALNLLPVQPLDGGRLLYLLLAAWRSLLCVPRDGGADIWLWLFAVFACVVFAFDLAGGHLSAAVFDLCLLGQCAHDGSFDRTLKTENLREFQRIQEKKRGFCGKIKAF